MIDARPAIDVLDALRVNVTNNVYDTMVNVDELAGESWIELVRAEVMQFNAAPLGASNYGGASNGTW